MNRTRSRPSDSAASCGDREVGDVDRVERPAEDAERPGHDRAAGPSASTSAPRVAPPTRARSTPIRTRSPAAIPARRSSASMPSRARSRWKRSADSSTSKLVWAAIRSMRRPRTRNAPSSSRLDAEPVAHRLDAVDDDTGRLGRLGQLGGVGQQRRRSGPGTPRRPSPSAAEIATTSRPSASRARRNAGQASAAAGRSILLKATSIGFSSSAGSWAAQLLADDVVVPLRVARRAVDDVDEDRASARRGAGTRGRARHRCWRPR